MRLAIRSTWKRVVAVLWIVAGGAWVCLSGGCATYLLTEHLPDEEPAAIVAATVRPDDHLLLDCVMTSGRHQRYDADLRSTSDLTAALLPPSDDAPLPPSARPLRFGDVAVAKAADLLPDAPAGDSKEERVARYMRRQPLPADATLTITIDPFGNFDVALDGGPPADTDAVAPHYYSGAGSPIDWRHPGTYAMCVLYPVTVGFDIVTAPIQAILLIAFWPRC